MKYAAMAPVFIALALAAPANALAQVSSANLLGNWKGTMSGFFGAKAVEPQPVKFMIEETNGRAFGGISRYENRDGQPTDVVFNGVIAPDGDGWSKQGSYSAKSSSDSLLVASHSLESVVGSLPNSCTISAGFVSRWSSSGQPLE